MSILDDLSSLGSDITSGAQAAVSTAGGVTQSVFDISSMFSGNKSSAPVTGPAAGGGLALSGTSGLLLLVVGAAALFLIIKKA